MGELSDRLRALADDPYMTDGVTVDLLREAAAELDRLGELLGAAAYSTDERWAHGLTARAQAEDALVAASGYWERVLAADRVMVPRSAPWRSLPRYTRPAKLWP